MVQEMIDSGVSTFQHRFKLSAMKITHHFPHPMAWRTLYSVLAVLAGIFLIVFGGYDDSPGGQLIGLLLTIFGLYRLVIGNKARPDIR